MYAPYLVITCQSRLGISHVAVSDDAVVSDGGRAAVADCRRFHRDAERRLALISDGARRRGRTTGARDDRPIDSHARRRLADGLDGSHRTGLQRDSDRRRRRLVVRTRSVEDPAAARVHEVHVEYGRRLVQRSLHLDVQPLLSATTKKYSSKRFADCATARTRRYQQRSRPDERMTQTRKINCSLRRPHKSVINFEQKSGTTPTY